MSKPVAPAIATNNPVIELNIGGVIYATSLSTLTSEPSSVLARLFSVGGMGGSAARPPKDSKGRCFVDRDGVLFRYVLDYLRSRRLVLPEAFGEKQRLRQEAEYYGLTGLVRSVQQGLELSKNS